MKDYYFAQKDYVNKKVNYQEVDWRFNGSRISYDKFKNYNLIILSLKDKNNYSIHVEVNLTSDSYQYIEVYNDFTLKVLFQRNVGLTLSVEKGTNTANCSIVGCCFIY